MATSGDLSWPSAGTFAWPRTLVGRVLRRSRSVPSLAGLLSSAGFDGGLQLPLSRLLEQGGASVLGLELDRWNEADLAVEPAEVEPVDVLGDGDLQVVELFHGPRLRTNSALNRLLNASAIALS